MKRDHVARLLHVIILSILLILIAALAPISPPRASSLLQFTSSRHALGFAADAVYVASGSHAYRVEFVNAASIAPVSDASQSDTMRCGRGVVVRNHLVQFGTFV